jgi:hypothetical protein
MMILQSCKLQAGLRVKKMLKIIEIALFTQDSILSGDFDELIHYFIVILPY